jgi:phospholipid/cholesterol/gamma-HCH transport system ATP-binding protein
VPIELKGVHKRFGNNHVLRGIDITVEDGTTVVIIGGSGTGKSVTLKHMVGILKPDEGTVVVDGEDISAYEGDKLAEVRRKFGYLFQSAALINWLSVYENVALPLRELTSMPNDEIDGKVREKLRLLQVEKAAHRFPPEISGGMKKRVGLARALIWDPEYLLFDEPTSGLDPVITATVDQMIIETREQTGVSSVVVTHDMASATRIADKIVMLYKGQVVEQAPPQEFMKSANPLVQQFIRGDLEGPITEDLRAAQEREYRGMEGKV